MHTLLLTLSVFLASFLGTALVRRIAPRYGWVAQPRKDRWHRKPTALLGGLGFYPAFLLGALVVLHDQFGFPLVPSGSWVDMPPSLLLALALMGGAMLMFFCGLLDDLTHFQPATKLVFQFAATSGVVLAGGIFPMTGHRVLDTLLTYFWFVGIINSVNMLDNMDGLCAGVMIIAGATIALMMGAPPPADARLSFHLGLVFIASLGGFLVHNRPPAAIFMGDCGSMFAGFVLAALAMPSALNDKMGIGEFHDLIQPVMALMIPVAVLAIPIFDTTLVTITRIWRAQKPSEGGRDHSSHRLVGLGLSERNAVGVLYSLAAFGGGMALLMHRSPRMALPVLGFFGLILIFTGIYLGRVRVQVVKTGQVSPAWTPLVSNLLYKRQAAVVVLDSVLIVLCFYSAYFLRFEGIFSQEMADAVIRSLPLVVAGCLLMNYFARIYDKQWRLMAVSDLPAYFFAAFGGMVLGLAFVTLATHFDAGYSRSVYVIFAILFFLSLVGSRLSFRILDSILFNGTGARSREQIPLLIYGAGKAGKILFEEIKENPKMNDYVVAGFIDDDDGLAGRRLYGIPIRPGKDWVGKSWPAPPEIWVSSRLISDEKARNMASQWKENIPVRRLKIEIV